MMKLIVAILILLIMHSHCAKFGPDNSYTCHCFNDEPCNTETGACSGHCATGWLGASCQKQNVAFGKPSSQVDTNGARTSDLAVDGRRSTNTPAECSDTSRDGTGRWWRVDLLGEYPVKNVTIYYQSKDRRANPSLNGFSLYVNEELCYKDNRETVHSLLPKNDIECGQVINGRYVNISNYHTNPLSRFLVLCEVEVYVCSVGTFGSDCTNFCHCLNNKRCPATGECPGRCSDGWTGSTCNQTCDNGKYGAGCIKQCSDRHCSVETSPCNYINGRCQGDCKDGFIEIDCAQRCQEDFYGEGCSKKCSDRKCKDSNLQCNSTTGECIDGCRPGYQSIDCTQECDNGTYGQGCQFNCSARFCQSPNNCSNIDGTCVCSEGYNGIDCTCKMATETSFIIQGLLQMVGVFLAGFIVGGLSDRFLLEQRVSEPKSLSYVSINQVLWIITWFYGFLGLCCIFMTLEDKIQNKHEQRFEKNYDIFIGCVQAKDISKTLFKNEVIDSTDMDMIQRIAKSDGNEKAMLYIMENLFKSKPTVLPIFIRCLDETGYLETIKNLKGDTA